MSARDGHCGICGRHESVNRYGQLDCSHCYPENFVGIIPNKVKKIFIPPKSKNIVDNPIYIDGIETLAESGI